jgi:hypothetical protein
VIAALLALPAFAQHAPDDDVRDRSDEYQDAYRKGYEKGFERGYSKGMADGQRHAVADPPAPPPPPQLGPVIVIRADYGSQAHRCEATRYMAKRADGKRNYSMEVSNGICGDPSPKDRKTLDVTYRCGDIEKTASAPEHRNIYLDCNS